MQAGILFMLQIPLLSKRKEQKRSRKKGSKIFSFPMLPALSNKPQPPPCHKEEKTLKKLKEHIPIKRLQIRFLAVNYQILQIHQRNQSRKIPSRPNQTQGNRGRGSKAARIRSFTHTAIYHEIKNHTQDSIEKEGGDLRERSTLGPNAAVVAKDGGGGQMLIVDVAHQMIINVRLPRHPLSAHSPPSSPLFRCRRCCSLSSVDSLRRRNGNRGEFIQ